MIISSAFAQEAAAAAPQEFSFTNFVPLIPIFAIFYFLIFRPQSKKMKEAQEMVNNLKVGNKVVTNGGIVGVVKDVLVKENQVEVEIAEGVRVKILKNYISDLVRDENKKTK
ncbi:MAG: preprotein translocase subunit YajC [Proteobacteria bacterium]|nr:preprotein translocase subunit YajC [Pseudomonadota bacterium]